MDEGSGETITVGGTAESTSVDTFGVTAASITITDDDTASNIIDLTVNDSSLNESDGGTATTITVTATLRGTKRRPVATEVRLNSTLGGTATSGTGNDYTHTALPATITIPAGELSAAASTFNITPLQDRIDEGASETITISGASTVGGTALTVNGATITVVDDDDPSTTVALSLAAASVSESGSALGVTVTATLDDAVRSSATTVALDLGGTAAGGGEDYSVSPSIPAVVIGEGQVSGTLKLTLTPVSDSIDEDSETITVGGTTEAEGLSVTAAADAITITDDDTVSNTISLSVSPDRVNEKNARTTAVTVTAELGSSVTRLAETEVTLELGGTASEGDDYTVSPATPPSVVIPEGQTSATAVIRITPRQEDDAVSETITVSGATTETTVFTTINSADITIVDDDTPSTSLTLTASPNRLSEPSGTEPGSPVRVRVTATLDAATRSADTTVTLTLGGAAEAGTGKDYTFTPATLPTITIPADEFTATETIEFVPLPDKIDEGSGETITVGGTATSGGTSLSVTGAGIELRDNDTASTIIELSVSDSIIGEEDSATTVTITATLSGTVTRSAPTVLPLRLGGSATLDVDYTVGSNQPGSITIGAGRPSATGTIAIIPSQDTVAEGNETIDIVATLTGFSVSGATVTLTDDDTAPPAAPADFAAARSGSNGARLTWTALTPAPDGYRLQRHDGDGNWTDVATDIAPAATGYTDRGLDYATTYFYRLFAYNSDGDSAPSDVESVTTANRPPPRRGGGGGGGSVTPTPSAPQPTPPSAPAPLTGPFLLEDVAETSVHAPGITTMLSLGVFTGTMTGEDPETGTLTIRFDPDAVVTRADIAGPLVRLWQVLGNHCPPIAELPFNDVIDAQARADVGCIYALGVTKGTGADTYSPDLSLNRAQVATMLVRLWKASGRSCPDDPLRFEDIAADSPHRQDIACLHGLGITNGTTLTTYSPHQPITKAQAATLFARLHTLVEESKTPLPDPG